MTPLQPQELRQFADVLRLRTGDALTIRFVEPGDVETLGRYFESLSTRTHYNRFLGATRQVPSSEYERMLHTGEGSHFAVVAEAGTDDTKKLVGEARYSLDPETNAVEFGISVADDWHGQGAGSALLTNLECRAAALGAERIFGDALNTNQDMLALARKRGYRLSHPPGDWTLVRFTKHLGDTEDVPCIKSSRIVERYAAMWW
jgi:RimJ/RimL family protein N-acetyltransferase